MKKSMLLPVSAITIATLALMGCQSPQDKTAKDTLVAVKVAAAPNMAAGAADPVWAQAKPISAELTGGANFGAVRR